MAATESTMLELGTPAPAFDLPDTEGGRVALGDYAGAPALLVMFISNHCPYVQHLKSALARLGADYRDRGVAVVAINSNDISVYPQDGPDAMRNERAEYGYEFPYLFDETQDVARAYRAACTPDFFVFDADEKLVYRGQFDDSRPGNGVPITGRDLRGALDAVLEGRPVPADQIPSIGCNIKWRSGNAPAYAG